MEFSISSIGRWSWAEKNNGFRSQTRSGGGCRMDTSSENQRRCFRELKFAKAFDTKPDFVGRLIRSGSSELTLGLSVNVAWRRRLHSVRRRSIVRILRTRRADHVGVPELRRRNAMSQ